MGNLVFGSGAEPGRASEARGGLTESPMERYYDATESDRQRYIPLTLTTEYERHSNGGRILMFRGDFCNRERQFMAQYHTLACVFV